MTTAQDIITALQNDTDWITYPTLMFRPNKHNRPYETTQVKFFTEVTMRMPTTKTSKRTGKPYKTQQRRRIDLVGLVKPNYKAFDLMLLGVEIKVSKSDLLNDKKMFSYAPYFHFMFLAVPEELADIAATYWHTSRFKAHWGFLSVRPDGSVGHYEKVWSVINNPQEAHLKEMYSELLNKQFNMERSS